MVSKKFSYFARLPQKLCATWREVEVNLRAYLKPCPAPLLISVFLVLEAVVSRNSDPRAHPSYLRMPFPGFLWYPRIDQGEREG